MAPLRTVEKGFTFGFVISTYAKFLLLTYCLGQRCGSMCYDFRISPFYLLVEL